MPDDIRHRIIRDVLGEVPTELADMPLNEALPKARRIVRARFISSRSTEGQPPKVG